MSINRQARHFLAGTALLLACIASFSQSSGSETLIKGKKVSKDELINSLTPEPAQPSMNAIGSDPEPKTRGFKLAPLSQQAPQTAPARKVSLLITFATNSAKLTKESLGLLDVMAEAMQSTALKGRTFSIEGHSDPRGDEARNLILSQLRAQAVMAYLVEQRGIERDRLSATGKGSSELLNGLQPAAPENRRVTFVNLKP